MGAWGVGHFDNDDAGDWVWELEDTGTASPVTAAFAAVEAEANYLEAPDACIALAAAEVVAAWAGNPAAETPDTAFPSHLIRRCSYVLEPLSNGLRQTPNSANCGRKARTLAPGGPWSRGCCGVCRRPEIRAHWCLWSGSPVSR